ncbi:chemotaxis protein CheB [Parachitinimonas caeni]|uniref:chemotaxis protein CheB n=1 Tax=Parachitinimonas caeni TaxID=3031301 RepID=UPI0027E593EF|nr:chemotaxis protein CheB [Parachitinimonas caeni]
MNQPDSPPDPSAEQSPSREDLRAQEIRTRIRSAVGNHATSPQLSADAVLPCERRYDSRAGWVIVMGASTGGTEALKTVLQALPVDLPPILITQHMPEAFTKAFASRLNTLCALEVHEAEAGMRLQTGHAYLAPGHSHLLLGRDGDRYHCELSQAPPVNRHRPSVDVLFRSVANLAGKNAIGVILTGMGKDGAQGMLEMRQAGAYNLAQDEKSCVVYGMPKEAVAVGAVNEIVGISQIAGRILTYWATVRGTSGG